MNRMILAAGGIIVGIAAAVLALATHAIPAAEQTTLAPKTKAAQGKKDGVCIDVMIEDVDLSANTITAVSTVYVVPPHDNVGGQMFMTGTTGSHRNQATEFVRLPVMPEARLWKENPKAGMHAILRLELLRHGALVVVGIEEFTEAERIGIDWLDAPGATNGE
jgi:hypothetical protein